MRHLSPAKRAVIALACFAGISGGCARAPEFADMASEFVYATLAASPSYATQAGLHRYEDPQTGASFQLDAVLDDLSPDAIARQRTLYRNFQRRLRQIDPARLDAQTQADYDLLSNAVSYALFQLDEERFFERKPQLYAEVLGNALFGNMSLEYADTATRAAHLAARLEQVPAFIATARVNLKTSNEIWRRVALEEMAGVADMIRALGATFVRGTPAEARYAAAQSAALASLERYAAFVRDSLAAFPSFDWRMGRERFATKWRYTLQSDLTPEEMLRLAEDSIRSIRTRMYTLAGPLHDSWFPGHGHAADSGRALSDVLIAEVMTRIGQEHAARSQLVAQAQRDVGAIADSVRKHRVLSLDDFSNIKVIPTPAFMQGTYGVAGAVFAPALEPRLSSFYWVTPIPPDWPAARAEAKLREYNKYKMLGLTIHEAIPGHLVQGEYANRVTPEWRRLLRSLFGSGTYIEGWAVYAEHVMEQLGLNGGDPVNMRLTALKSMLRIYANVVIDVRLHTLGMSADSVVPFLVRESFQEEPEAVAKLQRAQLDYVQLNLYPVGLHEWWGLRNDAEKLEGSAFNLCRFHDRVLSYGALPVPVVRRLYLAGVPPAAEMPESRCLSAMRD